jgi:tetratricopeptide (TPR) repeat protein
MKKGLTVLGTTYWRSYALFNAGVRRESEGDTESAEKLYVDALRLDPANRSARMNLAALLLARANNRRDRDRGVEQLRKAMQDAGDPSEWDADPVYYTAAVRLAATLYDDGQRDESLLVANRLLETIEGKLAKMKELPPLQGAMRVVFNAMRATPSFGLSLTAGLAERSTRKYLEKLHSRMRNLTLEKYLIGLRPSLLIMIAGLKAAAGDLHAIETMEDDGNVDRTVPSSMIQYNLACTYSIAAAKTRRTSERDKYLSAALSHLAFAQRLQPRHPDAIKADASLAYLKQERNADVELILTQYKPKPRVPVAPPAAAPAPA